MISTTQPLSSFEAKFLTTTATWPSGFRKAVTSPCCRGKGGNIWTSTWGDPCRPDRKLGHFEEGNMQMNDIYIYIYVIYTNQNVSRDEFIPSNMLDHLGRPSLGWRPVMSNPVPFVVLCCLYIQSCQAILGVGSCQMVSDLASKASLVLLQSSGWAPGLPSV